MLCARSLLPDFLFTQKTRRFLRVCVLPAALVSWLILSALGYAHVLTGQTQTGLSDGAGHPFGDCFINFWSAARLASLGHSADIYNWDIFHAFEQNTVHADLIYYHYSYPPVMPLLTFPLAWFPYAQALAVWLLATWALSYAALRTINPPVSALLLSVVTPAFVLNAAAGQNGMLTAALIGGGLAVLPRRPVVAGILFGFLCFKPQLAFLIPVALISGGYFRTLIVAGVTALALAALSVIAFGPDLWLDYMHTTQVLRHYVLEDNIPHSWQQFVSVFVALRQWGVGIAASYAAQGACALAAALVIFKLWRGPVAHDIRAAALVVGTFMATPYAMQYDLVVMTFVMVWLHRSYRHSGLAIAALLAMPILSAVAGNYAGVGIGPLLLLPSCYLICSSCRSPVLPENIQPAI